MKKKVLYDPDYPDTYIQLGECARILPVNHPDHMNVENGYPAITSDVLSVHPDGKFETLNTWYEPLRKEQPPPVVVDIPLEEPEEEFA